MPEGESVEQVLTALASKASQCTRCALAATRTNVVFGEGNPKSPLVIVGEGPGQQEDATGRPFVGRAGILLDECLAECGITRKHIYICNTVKCRACIVEGSRVRNRPPMPDELKACFGWLDQQLEAIKPLVILCLGAPSASTLIHKEFRMLAERGTWHTTCKYARYTMASLHPAFILRHGGDAFQTYRSLLVGDIEAARKKVIQARKDAKVDLLQ